MLRLVMAALAGFVVFFIGVLLVIPRVDEPLLAQLATAVLAFIGVPALVLKLWRPLTASEAARRAGRLEERAIHVVAAHEIQETEDEGPHFFLETAAGGTVYVSGQFLNELLETRSFPREHIKFGIDTVSRDVLAIELSGKRVARGKSLPAFTVAEHDADKVPDNLTEFPDPPRTILAALGRPL